jgi:DNA-binding beta-propeller fold protein YncE
MEVSRRVLARAASGVLASLVVTSVALAQAGSKAASAPKPAAQQAPKAPQAPQFTVDMLWPKPLPTHQLLGSAVGVAVDAQDHVFVVHRIDSFTARTEIGAGATPPIAECCLSAPPVLEFDATGKLVNSWGGPGAGYDWPAIPSGIGIDPTGNVWIAGSGGLDGQVLVFAHDGKFVRQIGKAGVAPAAPAAAPDTAYLGVSPGGRGGRAGGDSAGRGGRGAAGAAAAGRGGRGGRGGPAPTLPPNSANADLFGGATRIAFDAASGTAFIADGLRNRRVVTVDIATGAVKMFFGAYGKTPSDAPTPAYAADAAPSQQFSGVACAKVAKDGLVYVCDRNNDRIQVFKTDGSFIKEAKVAPATLGEGSVWDIAFSADANQRYLYVADGANQKVRILDRVNLQELTAFGEGGRVPGMFYAVHSIATDSKGNVYTTETYEGKRVQKFNFKGMGPVTKANQGVLWPGAAK